MADLRKKIVMIVSAVIVGISLIFTFVNYQNYSAKVDENRKQYHDLKSEYEDVTKQQKPVSEDDVKNGLNSVKKSGDDVANLFNQYLSTFLSNGEQLTKEQEDERKAEQEEISKQLDAYFGEGTNVRTSPYLFDANLIGNSSCWQFMNSYSFSSDSIDVLWECFDNSKNVIAYVTAKYHADSNSFDNVSQHMTTLGQTYMGVTGSDNASEKIDTTDTTTIFDVMQNAGLTQAQKDALAKARENMQPDDKDGINAAREQQKANSSNN